MSMLIGILIGAILGAAVTLVLARRSDGARSQGVAVAEGVADPVTGLATHDRLLLDVPREPDGGSEVTLYLFALDGFEEYNDAYGAQCGDALLAWLARKLRDAVGAYGTAYRMRGSSFALLAVGSQRFTNALCASAASALSESGDGFQISCDVGSASLPRETVNPREALELAARGAAKASSERHVKSGRRAPSDAIEALRLVRSRQDVSALATAVARRLDVPEAETALIDNAMHFCDVGNVAGPLGMQNIARLVRYSHERWDGAGYPDGLAGAEIPLGSRIVFVCSAFHDMTSDRPHHAALDPVDALVQLERGAGAQFDPDVVRAFRAEFVGDETPSVQAAEATLEA
jgi:GGDEF domain-containing protein